MKNTRIYSLLLLTFVAFFLQYCASPGPLKGGPKDTDPPAFIGSEPIKFATNQKPRKIIMEFDEFLVLKELSQNMIISPPLNEDPDVKLKGRKLLVKNNKEVAFEENTTYTYFFGDAVCDLHEDNPIEDFEFVFSTGPEIDSLSIKGKILQANTLEPIESAYVALYKDGINDTIPFDSLPYFIRPYYIARTNELGEYQLNNLRHDSYLMFAVMDANSNYFFDLPNEEIAFLDSLVFPQEVFEIIPDTIPINPADSILMDSLWEYHSYLMIENPIDLFMFLQDDSLARIEETNVEVGKKIEFYLSYPVRDSIHINLLNDSLATDWYQEEFSMNKDTLTLWLNHIPNDTLDLEIRIDTIRPDTLQFVVLEEKKKEERKNKRRKKKKDDKKKKEEEKIEFTSNGAKQFHYFNDLKLEFATPLVYSNFDYSTLVEDSLEVEAQFVFTDSLHRHLSILYPWKENTKYNLIIPKEALRDMFEVENDSIKLNFTTVPLDDYSQITLDVQFDSLFDAPMLIQLVKGEGEKEKIIKSHRLSGDSTLVIDHITEGDYYLKALEDINDNGQWNTGNYGLKRGAEKVFYFHLPITIKSGWDIEDKWIIKHGDRQRPEKPKKKKEEED